MEGRSTSVKKMLSLWAFCFASTLFWGFADLHRNPGLADGEVSLKPNFSQIGDLFHWGGRLVGNGRIGLFLVNAVLLSGAAALGSVLIVDWIDDIAYRRRKRRKSDQSVPPDGE